MQPQQGYLRKLTRFGLALIAIAMLTLPASASAVYNAGQATAAPKYRVLIVTAGSKKDGVNEAGVDAIKAIGKDTGASGKFSVFVAGNAEQINDQFTEPNLARYRAVIFLGTGANALLNDAQKAAFESYFHNGGGFLGIGSAIETEPSWQFYTDILGTRASGKTDVQSATVKVADRVHDASKTLPAVLEPDRRLVQLRGERPRRLACPRDGRRGSVRPAAAGPGPRRDRRRHDGRRPSGRLVQGLQGRPLLLHRRRQHRGQLRRGRVQEPSRRRDRLDGRRGRPRLQRLRRDRARELPADQDQRAAEPERADRLRPAPRRPRHPDRPSRRHPPARPGDRDDDDLSRPSRSTPSTRTASTAPRSTTTSPPTSGSISTTRRRRCRTSSCRTARSSRRRRRSTQRPTRAPASPFGTRGSATSSCPGSSSSTPPPARRRTSTCASEQQILRVTNNRGACCHVAGDIDFDKHNNLWIPTGDDSAGRRRQLGRLLAVQRHEDGRGPDGARQQRHWAGRSR